MYKSSCSGFFRTTTGIQSGPDALDESRFVMTFLTIMGVLVILCSFRLALEGKIGKETPESSRLDSLEKFLVNIFALSDAEGNTSGPLKIGSIAYLPLLRTLLAVLPKVPIAKFLGIDGPFCFSSICKFGSFQNPFATVTSLSVI